MRVCAQLCRRLVSAPVRVNMVVALADLASRWPNVLEPWTAYMYEPLSGRLGKILNFSIPTLSVMERILILLAECAGALDGIHVRPALR